MCVITVIDTQDKDELVVSNEKRLGVEALVTIIMNFDNDDINEYDINEALIYLKNRVTPPTKPSIKEPLVLDFKVLPYYSCYVFLRANNTLQFIIIASLLKCKLRP